jgi:hypothetical protein
LIEDIHVLYLAIAGLVLVHTIYLIAKRPYKAIIHNIAIIFNQLFILYGLFWVLSKKTAIDSPNIASLLTYLFIGLGYAVNLLGTVRSVLILRQKSNRE